MDQRLTLQDYANMLRNQSAPEKGPVLPWGLGNTIGGESECQKLVERARPQAAPNSLATGFLGRLTRYDPSTKTRVPVTQEWVDEAVAEIVRLNVELSTKAEPMPGTDMLKVDRIWEAVRAASAV